MKISIRPMTLEDYLQVRDIDMLTQRQYLGRKFDEMSREEQETRLVSRRSEFEANVKAGYSLVAEEQQRIVGFLLAYETVPFGGTIQVRYIGLRPAYQGKGIGLLLYASLIEKATQRGMKKIRAWINLDNPRSIRLHDKAGFTVIDRKEATIELDQ